MGHRARFVAAIVLSVAVLASLGLSGCTREKPAPTDPAWVPPEATAAVEGTARPLTGGEESPSGGATESTPVPSEAEDPEPETESPVVVPTPGGSTPVAQPSTFTYVVDPGDTLFSIATRYGTTVDVLVRLNRLASGDQISVGQSLQVPTSGGSTGGGGGTTSDQPATSGMHTVQSGETLFSIAQRYGLTTRDLMAANGITDPDRINVGQKLSIPGGGGGGTQSSGTEYHIVQSGETMLTIAVSYGISVQELASANGISDPDLISVGQTLIIP